LVITKTERFSRQRLSAAVAHKTFLVVKLLVVLHKLNVAVQGVPTDFTLLSIPLVVAFVTHEFALVFCESLAGQRFSTSGAHEAIAMVGAFVTCHVFDSTLDEISAGNAALGVVAAVAVFAHLERNWTDV